ncbi:transcriptional regulator [Actinotalea ferrariae]|uniref:transcriptional regulator n=1 Tax=Actinotalea ferrariae TaxID=1386098 RepID=UPI001C8C7E1B|nr:transcriptional regulator [Actinotalea ferrariae]MBX9245604.1 transcriptional regulator [Actinotalea ferrariae]
MSARTPATSPRDLLVLHAVRITGFGTADVVARRFGLDPAETEEDLLDAEARGWVQHSAFGDLSGWSLTDRGRAEDERRLAAELASVEGADDVRDVHGAFLPLNARLQRACTDWQLRPAGGDALAVNDHADSAWDARVLDELADIDRSLAPLAERLGAVLVRLQGYDARYSAALRLARVGEPGWVDGTDVDSCHRVWFELHEDLIATLGVDRRSGG